MNKEILLSVMAIVVLLVSGCVLESQPFSTETSMSTETSTETVFTATVNPTSTSIPTQTATPIPDWVTNFAEPILKAIENQPPKFQDDFSDPYSSWQIGKLNEIDPYAKATPPDPGQHFVGERGYVDGEYFTFGENYSCVWSGHNPNVGAYLDFVAEFDVRFFIGKGGNWQMAFRRNDKGMYSLVGSSNAVSFAKCPQTDARCEELATYSGNQVNGRNEWNHLLMIVRGARMAAYANGTPILYTEDKGFTDEFKMGRFALSVCSGSTPMEIRWDNLKLWDIQSLL